MKPHTPTPWKARDYKNSDGGIWIDCDSWRNPKTASCRGGTLATCHSNGTGKEGTAEGNAAFIVEAVNQHDDLLWLVERARAIQKADWTRTETARSWADWEKRAKKLLG